MLRKSSFVTNRGFRLVILTLMIVTLVSSFFIGAPQNVNAEIYPSEMINNGSFENDFTSWNTSSALGGASIDTATKLFGAKSLKFQGTAGQNPFVCNPSVGDAYLTINPAKSYNLDLFVRTDGITTGKFSVYVLDCDASDNAIGWESYNINGSVTYELAPVTGTQYWTEKAIALRPWNSGDSTGIHTNTHHIKVYLYMVNTSGRAWVDGVSLTDQGYVNNGGFENDLAYWFTGQANGKATIDTTVKYFGQKSLKFDGTAGSNPYVFNPEGGNAYMKIDPSKSYELSMYVKTKGITTGKFSVYVLDCDASDNAIAWESYDVGGSISYELSPVTGTQDWRKEVITLRPWNSSNSTGIHANTDHIKIHIYMVDNSGTAWVDEVKLVDKPVLPQLVNNGGFESDFDNWYTGGAGGGASIDTVIKNSGTKSMKLQGALSQDRTICNPLPGYSTLKLDVAKSYELSMYVKTSNITTGKFNAYILDSDSSDSAIAFESYNVGGTVTYEVLPVTGTTDWTKLTLYLHPYNSSDGTGIHTNTDHIKVYLRVYNTSGTAWVDDVSLKVKETVNITVDANTLFNESSGNDITKMKSLISSSSDVASGNYNRTAATTARLNEIGQIEVRTPNLFNGGVTRDGQNNLVYNFSVADTVVGGNTALGLKSFVQFGVFTPQTMSVCPDSPLYSQFSFANWSEYEDYIYQILKDFYVTHNYNVTYWEVGNEPDLGWFMPNYPNGCTDKYAQYWLKYKHAAAAFNKFDTDYPNTPQKKLGGPAITTYTFNTMGWAPYNWIQKMLQDAYNEGIRLDYVSYHVYGSTNTFGGQKDDPAYQSFESQITSVKNWRNTYKPNAEILVTEWGPSEQVSFDIANFNGNNAGAAYNINFVYSAMKADGITKLVGLGTKDYPEACVRYINNTTEMFPVPGFRSMWSLPGFFTNDYVVKAAYNVAKMMYMMADSRIKADFDATDNEVRVLASKDSGQITVLMSNDHISSGSTGSVPVSDDRTVKVTVNNVSSSLTTLKYVMYRVDENTSNAFKYYKDNIPFTNGNSGLQVVGTGTVTKTGTTVVLPSVALDKESTVLYVLNLNQDDTAPSVPVISTSSQSTNSLKILVSGTAEANARVELVNNDTPAGICYANSSGNWYEEIKLSDGSNSIKARAIDKQGNASSYSSAITITKASNTVTAPVLSGGTYQSTASKTFTVSGTAQPGKKVNIYRNILNVPKYYISSRSVLAAEITVDGSGNFSKQITLSPEDEYCIVAQAYDDYGNLSPESSAIIVTCTYPRELLPNGGFDNLFSNWTITTSNGRVNLDTANYVSGYSAKWEGNGTTNNYIYTGWIAVDNSKTYQLSDYIKTSGITSGDICIRILDLNSNGGALGFEQYWSGGVKTDKIHATSGTTSGFIRNSTSLTPYQADGTGRISGTAYIVVYVYFDGVNTGGYAWIDSMKLSLSVADQATATASSYYSSNYIPSKVFDGIVGQNGVGEWASLGEQNPWIQLTWSSSKTISSIVLYDRPNLTDNANGGTLTFSDGSYINVTGIPNDGTAKEITFASKNVTWVKFQVSGGSGSNVGLSEIQAY